MTNELKENSLFEKPFFDSSSEETDTSSDQNDEQYKNIARWPNNDSEKNLKDLKTDTWKTQSSSYSDDYSSEDYSYDYSSEVGRFSIYFFVSECKSDDDIAIESAGSSRYPGHCPR